MHLTIKTKLLLVLLGLSGAFAAAAAVGWIGLDVNHRAFQTVYRDRVVCLTQLKDVSDAYAVRIVGAAYQARGGQGDAAAAVRAIDVANNVIGRQWHAYFGTYLTPVEARLAGDTTGEMATADAAVARLRAMIVAGDRAGIERFVANDLHPAIDPVVAALGQLVDLQLRVATNEFVGADSVFLETRWVELLLGFVGLTVVTLGAWMTICGVARPLGTMIDTMRRIAAKDFSVVIPAMTRRDEIGDMARAIEVLRQAGTTNEKLRAANEAQRAWLERVLDELPVGVTLFGDDGRLMVRNKTMNLLHPHPDPARLIGLSLAEMIREVFKDSPDVIAEDMDAFIREHTLRYDAGPEGRFETKFPGGAEISAQFRWIGKNLVIVHTDVTALRDAERRATLTERQLRSIIESLPTGLAFYDEQERLVLRNAHADDLIQMSGAEIAGGASQEDVLCQFPPDDVATSDGRVAQGNAVVGLVMETFRTQAAGVLAARHGDRHVAVNFRNLPGMGRIVATTDVTDLVHARRAAQESEQRLRSAIAEIPISFALFSPDGALLLFNEAFRHEFRDVAHVIQRGASVRDIVAAYLDTSNAPPPRFGSEEEWQRIRSDPAHRAALVDKLADTFLHGPAEPLDVQRDYGTYRLRRVTLPNGEIARVSADITDLRDKEAEIRRLGESALAQRTAILQEVIDTIPQAIAVTSPDRQIRFTNRSLGRLLAAEPLTAPTGRLPDIFVAIGASSLAAEELSDGGAHEAEIVTDDQRPLLIRTTSVATGDTLVTISDLSEQRRAEAERLEQQQRVLQAEKGQAVLTLAGTIAHDFNNLLAVILGFSSIAADAAEKVLKTAALDVANARELADVKSSVEKVITSAERGRNVVASLNALTHDRKVGVERLDLRATVRDVEELLRVLVPASIRLDLNLAKLPCPVLANGTQIEQIVTNLCVNAVHALDGKAGLVSVSVDRVDVDGGRADGLRATPAAVHRGGSHVEVADDGSVSMFVGVLGKGRHVRLRVADNGHGMTEDVARKIFTPFFTTKPPGVGTGLGLSSVIEIVAAHNGGIHVRTKPQVGTTFMILLPLAAADVARPEPVQAGDGAGKSRTTGDIRTDARVLVIDDESLLAELAANVLRKAGYEVEGFTDPAAALSRIIRDPQGFDLIITDQTMPGMTGLELIEQIRPLSPNVPIIICTGFAPEVEKGGAASLGINKVLRKPYSPLDLAKLVREALAEPPSFGNAAQAD